MDTNMDTRTIYLSHGLEVIIGSRTKEDYIELSFDWNKSAELLPFEEDIREIVDGCIVHKNPLTVKLVKYLMGTANHKCQILSKLHKYIDMSDDELDGFTGLTPVADYRGFLRESLPLFKGDQHIALIALLSILWY